MTTTTAARSYRVALLPQPDLVGRPCPVRAAGRRRARLWSDATAVALSAVLGSWVLPGGTALHRLAALAATAGWLALLAATGRAVIRGRLHRRRRRGLDLSRVLLVGQPDPVARASATLAAGRRHGYLAVAACLPGDGLGQDSGGAVPGSAQVGEVLETADRLAVDAVALVGALDLSDGAVVRLAEGLAARSIPFLVARETLAATSWASRASVRSVPGLPFVRIVQRRVRGLSPVGPGDLSS